MFYLSLLRPTLCFQPATKLARRFHKKVKTSQISYLLRWFLWTKKTIMVICQFKLNRNQNNLVIMFKTVKDQFYNWWAFLKMNSFVWKCKKHSKSLGNIKNRAKSICKLHFGKTNWANSMAWIQSIGTA
jgi:hypothetical protein